MPRVRCTHEDCGAVTVFDGGSSTRTVSCTGCGRSLKVAPSISNTPRSSSGISKNSSMSTPLPAKIGRYEVRQRLGLGGFGEVFRAYDPQLERDVAVKVPRAEVLATKEQVERFLREAKAAARLNHPNIVPVYDTGRDGDRVYIASKFISGKNLAELVRDYDQNWSRIAHLVQTLAAALHYAHRRKIVHRDVKPHNILVDDEGEPYLTDFGLARMENDARKLTHDGTILGTPAYMSPEQAKSNVVAATSDQYSLGVVLYELLTGETPFSGPPAIVIYNILNGQAPLPRSVNPRIPRDLETICLKALAREPDRRYADCGEFASDLERWQQDRPITARRVTWSEQALRWCRRNPLVAGLTIAVVVVSVIGFVISSSALAYSWMKESEARSSAKLAAEKADEAARHELSATSSLKQARENLESANRSAKEALTQAAEASFLKAISICEQGDVAWGLLELAHALQLAQKAEHLPLAEAVKFNLVAWRRLTPQLEHMLEHPAKVTCLAISDDGDKLAVGAEDGSLTIWSTLTGFQAPVTIQTAQAAIGGPVRSIVGLGFWRDSPRMVTASVDGEFRVYDTSQKQPLVNSGKLTAGGGQISCDPTSRRFAVGNWSGATVYDSEKGDSVKVPVGGPCEAVEFLTDGRLAVLDNGTQLHLLTASTFQPIDAPTRTSDGEGVRSVAIATNQRMTLLGAGHLLDPAAVLLRLPDREVVARIPHSGTVTKVCFSHNSQFFVSGSTNATVKFYDVASSREMPCWLRSNGRVSGLAFFPGDDLLALAAEDRFVRIWKTPIEVRRHLCQNLQRVLSVKYSPDGETLASAAGYSMPQLRLWNARTGKLKVDTRPFRGNTRAIAYAPDGKSAYISDAVQGGPANEIVRWHLTESPPDEILGAYHEEVWKLDLTPDGETLCTGNFGRIPRFFSIRERKYLDPPMGHQDHTLGTALSDNGDTFLTGSLDKTIRLWDVQNRKPRTDYIPQTSGVRAAVFHPGKKSYFLGSVDGVIRQFDLETHQQCGPSMRHQATVSWLSFSRDKKLLISAGMDGVCRLWHPDTGHPVGPLMQHPASIFCLDVNSQRDECATGDERGAIQTWNLPDLSEVVSNDPVGETESLVGAKLDSDLGIRILDNNDWNQRQLARQARSWTPRQALPKDERFEIEIPKSSAQGKNASASAIGAQRPLTLGTIESPQDHAVFRVATELGETTQVDVFFYDSGGKVTKTAFEAPGEISLDLRNINSSASLVFFSANGYATQQSPVRLSGGKVAHSAAITVYKKRYVVIEYSINRTGSRMLDAAHRTEIDQGLCSAPHWTVPTPISGDWQVWQNWPAQKPAGRFEDSALWLQFYRIGPQFGFADAPADAAYEDMDEAPESLNAYKAESRRATIGLKLFFRTSGQAQQKQESRYGKLRITDISLEPQKSSIILKSAY